MQILQVWENSFVQFRNAHKFTKMTKIKANFEEMVSIGHEINLRMSEVLDVYFSI